jgi:nitroimidazol reductase NimA-like FMN-containing flavoprotein (pyridoxamine 5'-phosphate oxidase superfamily)
VSAREDLGAVARAIIDGNRYMVLGTADADGRPWVTPVYYAPSGYAELYWVSSRRRTTRVTSRAGPS